SSDLDFCDGRSLCPVVAGNWLTWHRIAVDYFVASADSDVLFRWVDGLVLVEKQVILTRLYNASVYYIVARLKEKLGLRKLLEIFGGHRIHSVVVAFFFFRLGLGVQAGDGARPEYQIHFFLFIIEDFRCPSVTGVWLMFHYGQVFLLRPVDQIR